ncbi:MAG TPA: TRAP transporter large permease subunit, partial [Rhodospirillales bacterium]|nr:TRAP transporter large permease subunit [Rhodospirillales bacterium]
MDAQTLSLLMFLSVCGLLMVGFPVAFTLAGTAFAFAFAGSLFGAFDLSLFGVLPSRYFGIMVNPVLVAVPLFIFMGVMLERAKIAEQLLETMSLLFGRLRGGMGLSVIFVGMLLAASTGIVGATVVTMGLLSLPTMLKAGYDKKLSCGIICASGTLGQIIPPSIILVLLGDVLQGSYAEAQRAIGNWAPEPVSVIDLFAGAFIPGVLLVVLYMGWVVVTGYLRPKACPISPKPREGMLARQVITVLLPPALLIFGVLGSILAGVATPTESAAVGAAGAMLIALLRKRLSMDVLKDVMRSATRISTMVFVILLGASVFSLVFRGFGGDDMISKFLHDLPGGAFSAVLAVMLVMFVLGFFLDFIEIIFVVVPIVGPILLQFDISPVWLGVMIAINLQTSFLTPPFGFALFYLRGVAPDNVTTMDIYRGAA